MPKIGLKNLYLARVLIDDPDVGTIYEVPKRLHGLIQADIKPASSTENFYSDDMTSETIFQLGDISIDLEIGDIPSDMQMYMLGAKIDSNGVIHYSNNDVAPYMAIGYEAALSKGGSRYEWLFKGKFNLPESSSKTKGDKVEYQTQKISGVFIARKSDGEWKTNVDSTDNEIGLRVKEKWFEKVYKRITLDGEYAMDGALLLSGKVVK